MAQGGEMGPERWCGVQNAASWSHRAPIACVEQVKRASSGPRFQAEGDTCVQRPGQVSFPGISLDPQIKRPLEGAWRTSGDEGLSVPVAPVPGPSGEDRPRGAGREPGQWALRLGDLAAATYLLFLVTDLLPKAQEEALTVKSISIFTQKCGV